MMARLLQVRQPVFRVSEVWQAWLASRRQRERRHRAPVEPEIAAPVLDSGTYIVSGQDGYADVSISYRFNHAGLAMAHFEVWLSKASMGWIWGQLTTITSNSSGVYVHSKATQFDTLRYRMRYVNGGVIGPYSNTLEVAITMPE